MSSFTAPHASLTQYPSQPPLPPRPGIDPNLPEIRVTPPVVYVERAYEYKQVGRGLVTGEAPITDAELNELGGAGWELVSVLSDGSTARFYFKRIGR
ncbi:MAG: hypothetical protein ACYC0B_06665 [Gemmatimonadaceae bacterium]